MTPKEMLVRATVLTTVPPGSTDVTAGALLTIGAGLNRIAGALERIADLAEKAFAEDQKDRGAI